MRKTAPANAHKATTAGAKLTAPASSAHKSTGRSAKSVGAAGGGAPRKSMTTIPFVTDNGHGGWTLHKEAADMIAAVPGPLAMVSIIGKYRTGKSWIWNALLGVYEETDAQVVENGGSGGGGGGGGGGSDNKKAGADRGGFAVGSRTTAVTKGLWIMPRLWHIKLADGSTMPAVAIDTEGLGDPESTTEKDVRIFVLAFVLSSLILYNSVGPIDEPTLEQLNMVTELAKHLRLDRPAVSASSGAHAKKRRRSAGADEMGGAESRVAQSSDADGDVSGGGGVAKRVEMDDRDDEGESAQAEEVLTDDKRKEFDALCPALLWILRDFALEVDTTGTNAVENKQRQRAAATDVVAVSNDYMETALADRVAPAVPREFETLHAIDDGGAGGRAERERDRDGKEPLAKEGGGGGGHDRMFVKRREEYRKHVANVARKNGIRRHVRKWFPRRQCVRMRRPAENEGVLQRLHALGLKATRPEFQEDFGTLKRQLGDTVQTKKLHGKPASGSAIIAYTTAIVNAINIGRIPVLRDAIASAAFEQLVSAKQDASQHWDTSERAFFKAQKQKRRDAAAVAAASSAATPRQKDPSPTSATSSGTPNVAPAKQARGAGATARRATGPTPNGTSHGANGGALPPKRTLLTAPTTSKAMAPAAPTKSDPPKAVVVVVVAPSKRAPKATRLTDDAATASTAADNESGANENGGGGGGDGDGGSLGAVAAERTAGEMGDAKGVLDRIKRKEAQRVVSSVAAMSACLEVAVTHVDSKVLETFLVGLLRQCEKRFDARAFATEDDGDGDGDDQSSPNRREKAAFMATLDVKRRALLAENERRRLEWLQRTLLVSLEEQLKSATVFHEFAELVQHEMKQGGAAVAAFLYPKLLDWACRFTEPLERRGREMERAHATLHQQQQEQTERAEQATRQLEAKEAELHAAATEMQGTRTELAHFRNALADQSAREARWQSMLEKMTADGVAEAERYNADMRRQQQTLADTLRQKQETEEEAAGLRERTALLLETQQELDLQKARVDGLQNTLGEARQSVAALQEQLEAEIQRAAESVEAVEAAQAMLASNQKQAAQALRNQTDLAAAETRRLQEMADAKSRAAKSALDELQTEMNKLDARSKLALKKETERATKVERQLTEVRAASEAALDNERKQNQAAQRELKVQLETACEKMAETTHTNTLLSARHKGLEQQLEHINQERKKEAEKNAVHQKAAQEHKQCATKHDADRKKLKTEHALELKTQLDRLIVDRDEQLRVLRTQLVAQTHKTQKANKRYTDLVNTHSSSSSSSSSPPSGSPASIAPTVDDD